MAPQIGQILETVLYSSNPSELAEWYKRIFSLQPFIEGPVIGFSLPNNTILLLFDPSKTSKDTSLTGASQGLIPKHGIEGTGRGQHISFACDDVAEWEAWFEEQGVKVEGRMSWEMGGKSLYVRDSEGHLVEVMTRGVWKVY
ncbi:hypothetical protein Q7P37_005974 [Cladosporium fusiforme]